MRSTASFKGHPIHPALIPFPFAFLTGALLFDLAGWILDVPAFTATAKHLAIAGIAFGLLAAVPGIIDYLNTVPPRSSGKKRARLHGMLNVTAIALFGAAVWIRGDGVSLAAIGLEAIGTGVLSYSGWLGGTLVNRNMIGVDHRYAEAGKWNEAVFSGAAGPIVVAREQELKPGQMKLLHVDGKRIVLGRNERGYVAFDDRCTHRGGSLAGGVMIGDTVQCLWHGSQFNTTTGRVVCGPATDGISCYRVETANGEVRLLDARQPAST